jgi:hypothetical protein
VFARRFFPGRYFAPAYFPQSAEYVEVAVAGLTYVLELGPRLDVTAVLEPRFAIADLTLQPLLTMTSLSPDEIPLNTDSVIRARGVRVFDPVTGTRILATGITLHARIALTPTGPAVHSTVEMDLAERAPGDFHGTLQGDAANTHLRDSLGELVFLVLSVGSGDYLGHKPVRVVDGVRVR